MDVHMDRAVVLHPLPKHMSLGQYVEPSYMVPKVAGFSCTFLFSTFTVSFKGCQMPDSKTLLLCFMNLRSNLPELDLDGPALGLGEPSGPAGGGELRGGLPSAANLWSCSLCNCSIIWSILGLMAGCRSPAPLLTDWASEGLPVDSVGWGSATAFSSTGTRSPRTSCWPIVVKYYISTSQLYECHKFQWHPRLAWLT